MTRGVARMLEKHHQVRINDEAVVAAVQLSIRYLPERQLPDKAISLLDSACSRVSLSRLPPRPDCNVCGNSSRR